MKIIICVFPTTKKELKKCIIANCAVKDSDFESVEYIKDTFPIIEQNKGEVLIVLEQHYIKDDPDFIGERFSKDDFMMINLVENKCVRCRTSRQNGGDLLDEACFDKFCLIISVNKFLEWAKTPKNKPPVATQINPVLQPIAELPASEEIANAMDEFPFIERKFINEKGMQKINLNGVSYFTNEASCVVAVNIDDSCNYFLGTLNEVEKDCLGKGLYLRIDSGILINLNQVKSYCFKKLFGEVTMITGKKPHFIVRTRVENAKKSFKKHIAHLEIKVKTPAKNKKKISPKNPS